MELDDVDAVLVAMIRSGEAVRPWQNAEAVAVRAIVALSRAGAINGRINGQEWRKQARTLMADLIQTRV